MLVEVMQYFNKDYELISVLDGKDKIYCINLKDDTMYKVFNGRDWGFDFVNFMIDDIYDFDEFIINDDFVETISYIVENEIENGNDDLKEFYEKIKYYYL